MDCHDTCPRTAATQKLEIAGIHSFGDNKEFKTDINNYVDHKGRKSIDGSFGERRLRIRARDLDALNLVGMHTVVSRSDLPITDDGENL